MKIVKKNNKMAFKALFVCDVFIEKDGTYWMKVDPIDEWIDPDCSEIRNAVNLVDGTWCFVEDEAQVEYVECELRIK